MKKKICLFLIVIPMLLSAQYKERINISGFGGWEQNSSQHNRYGGVYVNGFVIKTDEFMIGPYLMVVASDNSESTGYHSESKEYAGGLCSGWYSSSFLGNVRYNTWFSPNLGVKYVDDRGRMNLPDGQYDGHQYDWLLSTGLDFSIWQKRFTAFLPRIQLQFSYQIPTREIKESFWNGSVIDSEPWNKEYFSALGKASLVNVPFAGKYLSPKAVGSYAYETGNAQWSFGLGGEISLLKPGQEDLIAVYGLYKFRSRTPNTIFIGILINPTSL